MSPDTISTITDAVLDEVMVWHNCQCDEFYPVIFLDALRVKIRDGHRVVNKACYMAVDIDTDGIKSSWDYGSLTVKVLHSGHQSAQI